MLIDTKKIKEILDNETGYSIGKAIGMRPQAINKYQNGSSQLDNMTLGMAKKIMIYVGEIEKANGEKFY